MNDRVCTLALQLTLLHKYNYDDIEDDNGQTFSGESSKPRNAFGRREGELGPIAFVMVSAVAGVVSH